jgi:cytoskeletal protein CcmA (bactofilin family)
MSGKSPSDFNEANIDTILSDDIDCKGKLKFNNKIIIKGKFEGEIEAEDGHLLIGPKAEIVSNTLKTSVLSNKGKIFGNVQAKTRIELYKGSLIEGDIITPDLYVESGSMFNGNCTMINKDK